MPRVLIDLSVAPSGGAATYATGFIAGFLGSEDPDKDRVVIVLDHDWVTRNAALVSDLSATGAELVVEQFPPAGSWRTRLTRGRVIARVSRNHSVEAAYFPRDAAPRMPVPTVVLLNNRYAWEPFASGQAIGGRVPALLLRIAAKLTVRRAASVLAVSRSMGDAARGVRIDGVVHHGCSLPEHPRPLAHDHPDQVASSAGRSEGPPSQVEVLMVGNLIENKGAEVVVEGLAEVQRKGGAWNLRIYGSRMDPAYADRVEALSVRLFGESVLHPPVGVEELVLAYRRADVLVMGGAFESFCHPLVEGMRSGCVVVAPDTDLVREICGDVAVTYREGDPIDLARALQAAASDLPERSRRGIERSRAFDWVDAVDRTLAAVRRAAIGSGGPDGLPARLKSTVGSVWGQVSRSDLGSSDVQLSKAEQDRARVLIGMSVAPPGGASTYVEGFARGVANADISNKDQLVVLLDSRWASSHVEAVDVMRSAGIGVVTRDFPEPGTWRARLLRGRVIRRVGRDAGVQAAFFAREVGPAMPVPRVVLARNLYAWLTLASGAPIGGRMPAWVLRQTARRSAEGSAAVLAVSEQIAGYVPTPVTAVVHHGCLLPEHPRSPRRELPETTRVISVGNLNENKGIETVIAGIARVSELDSLSWDLGVYGKRLDAAYADAVERLSWELLGTSVLCGPAYGDDLIAAYHAADIVVVGTTFESFCHPLVEGMRSGCVVVAPESVLVADICGDVAVTYAEGDPGALAEALIQARAELDDRSRRGIERSRMFTWERTAAQTVAVARSVAVHPDEV